MEKLEESVRDIEWTKSLPEKELPYEGLILKEDKPYMSGTSIKYWM